MSDPIMTLQEMREITSVLMRNAIKPQTVLTEQEATEMTERDPAGHVWQVGEPYYKFPVGEQK